MKKPTVILLSGHSGCGKDYVANIMKQELEAKNKKVLITHYADLLKYILKTFFNWNGEKDEHGRHLLQYVGTDTIRKQNPDYWVDFITNIITMFSNEWDYILIPDTRFPNEIEKIKNNPTFNTLTVRINRLGSYSKLTEEQRQHISETALDNYSMFDFILCNDNTEFGVRREIKKFFNVYYVLNNKETVFIDLDCTTYNTVKCITELYDDDFKYYSDYKKIPWEEVKSWNFLELSAAKPEYINTYFNQPRFFKKVEMFEDAKETIDKLKYKYNIVFISHGYSPNLRLKEVWVKEHFPYAEFIGVNLKEHKDKSCVDMKNGIFIDDIANNLESSNADIKICFGMTYDWNKDFFHEPEEGNFNAYNWKDVEGILL